MKQILALSSLLLLMISVPAHSQTPSAVNRRTMPLEQLLNPDGTINTQSGFSGTLDPKGYRMAIDPQGTPRFTRVTESAAAVPADTSWDDKFVYPGTEWLKVRAIAVSGTNVYVGGDFNYIHNIQANRIAKWDGSTWSELGLGLRAGFGNWAMVNAIAVSGGDVYVAGGFDTAGTVPAKNVARWDGTTWFSLGSGIPSAAPTAITADGANVYFGGPFINAGGVSANYIAMWNGSVWSALGSGLSGGWYGTTSVNVIAASGGNVYVGGVFSTAGGVIAKNIARWDGSNWFALGPDTIRASYGGYSLVSAIAISESDLYIGGVFDSIGTVSTTNIAKWDGSTWSALGTGANSTVRAIAVKGTDVYAGGDFNNIGGVSANQVARWDGANWYAMGTGLNYFGNVYALASSGSDVFLGGDFTKVGGEFTTCVAKWNGSSWSSIPSGVWLGLNSSVQALAMKDNDLFFGGNFNNFPCINSIGKFNGTSLTDVSCGHFAATIKAIAVVGETLYVGGTNMHMGGTYSFLQWDSSHGWSYFSSPKLWDGTVNAIAVVGKDIYAAGRFGWPNTVSNIARWDGTSWSALGTGISRSGGYEQVYALAVIGSDLYVAGYFDNAGGITVNGFAKWNGTTWSAVGSPSGPDDGSITVLAAAGNTLYAGGWFTSIGGVSANQIAKWNGTTWSALGTGLSRGSNDEPHAIVINGTDVYVGGKFTTAGGVSAVNMAKWNGSSWSALGSGVEGVVYSLCVSGPDLYVGGNFTIAGGKPSLFWGRWRIPQGYFVSSVTSLQFDSVAVPGMKTDSITVENHGYAPLVIGSATSNNPQFIVNPTSGTIPALSNQKFYVTFSPDSGGIKNGEIVFSHNGFGSHDTVHVTGRGYIVRSPEFLSIPASIFFGLVSLGSTKLDSAYIQNLGDSALIISSVLTMDPELTVHPGGASIAPHDSEKFYFTFSRVSPSCDLRVDTIIFIHNGVGTQSAIVCTADNRVIANVHDGWNMVSVPVLVIGDYLRSSIYPASSSAFAYRGSYQVCDTLRNGEGYWVKFGTSQSVPHKGVSIGNDSVDVRPNWNMIGSISSPVAVSNISSVPDGIATSNFFGYDGAYSISDSILPGRAYWVKVSQSGRLILSDSPHASPTTRIRIVSTDELPPPPPDNIGNQPDNLPKQYALAQNYPNPFNPLTVIRYELPFTSIVRLKIFNVLGQEVMTLADGIRDAGYETAIVDASTMASGFYFYRLDAACVTDPSKSFTEVMKMILMK